MRSRHTERNSTTPGCFDPLWLHLIRDVINTNDFEFAFVEIEFKLWGYGANGTPISGRYLPN